MIKKLYKGQIEIEFKEASHRYKVNGVYSTGVTTVCNVLFKDLLDWAAWMATEQFKELVSPYLTSGERLTKAELKRMGDTSKKAHRVKADRGKDVGTIVHEWIKEECASATQIDQPDYVAELLEKSETAEETKLIGENMKSAEHCVKQWRKWMKDYDVEIIKSEFIIHSRKLGYCGTVDVLFRSRRTGKVYIGDYKTSEPQKIRNRRTYQIIGYKPYPEHFVQISGYDYAHHEEFLFEPDGYMVIYLPKEKDYHVFTREQVERDREGWEHLFKLYQWIEDIKKGR